MSPIGPVASMRNQSFVHLIAPWLLVTSFTSLAAVPPVLHHQGRVTVDNVNFDGIGYFKFLLFTDSDADHSNGNETALWKNDDAAPTDLNEPLAAFSLAVTKGLYSLRLGEAPQAALPASLVPPTGEQLYLRTWFDNGVNGSQQLSPDQQLASVPFALHSASSGGNLSDFINDAGFIVAEDFDFVVESDSAFYTGVQLGAPSGSFATSFTFAETFTDPPTVTLDQTTGITNPVVSNVTTTGFDLSFDYAIVPGVNPVPANDPWPHFDLLIVGGNPAIIYADGPPQTSQVSIGGDPPTNADQIDSFPPLNFRRAAEAGGSAWDPPIQLGNANVRSASPLPTTPHLVETFDAALIGGNPAVAYVEASPFLVTTNPFGFTGTFKLVYQAASDSLGTAFSPRQEISLLGDAVASPTDYLGARAGTFVSLAEIGGRPAVFSVTPGTNSFAATYSRATDASGTGWNSTDLSTLLPTQFYALSNLFEIGGKPAIAYVDVDLTPPTSSDPQIFIEILVANDADGSTWQQPVRIWSVSQDDFNAGTSGNSGTIPLFDELRLLDVGGRPALSFSSRANSLFGVHFVRASDAAGTSWPAANLVVPHGPGFPADSDRVIIGDALEVGGTATLLYKKGEEVFSIAATNIDGTAWGSASSVATGIAGIVRAGGGPSAPVISASDFTALVPDQDLNGTSILAVPPTGGIAQCLR